MVDGIATIPVLANVTIQNIADAENCSFGGEEYFVVSVTDHKTAYKGPVMLPLNMDEFNALRNVGEYVRATFPEVLHHFVTREGKAFTTTRVGYEWRSA